MLPGPEFLPPERTNRLPSLLLGKSGHASSLAEGSVPSGLRLSPSVFCFAKEPAVGRPLGTSREKMAFSIYLVCGQEYQGAARPRALAVRFIVWSYEKTATTSSAK